MVASMGILPRVPWVAVLTALAAMMVATAVTHAFGSALRNTDAQLEAAMTDLKIKLYNEAGFFTYGNEVLAQCRARKKPLTMVLLNGADMHDIRELVSRIASERLMLRAVQGITAALPAGGLAASMGKQSLRCSCQMRCLRARKSWCATNWATHRLPSSRSKAKPSVWCWIW